jgi:hypothetical protein
MMYDVYADLLNDAVIEFYIKDNTEEFELK